VRRWLQTEPPVGNNQLYKNRERGRVSTWEIIIFHFIEERNILETSEKDGIQGFHSGEYEECRLL
jgi:hypothetical protein